MSDSTIRRSKICHISYKMGWSGTAAFQALNGDKELVFDLADGLSVPPEFKEGDDIDIILHPDHPANIAMGMKQRVLRTCPSEIRNEV